MSFILIIRTLSDICIKDKKTSMHTSNLYNKINSISDKGQKIVAALYLVTNHLSDTEPMKVALRSQALELHNPTSDRSTVVALLSNTLKSASMAKIITEHNVAILVRELTTFAETVSDTLSLASFFVQTPATMSRTNAMSYKQQMAVSIERQGTINSNKNQDKNKRQEQILSFINGRKSAVIKDISSLFPDVSEKTIQRELGTLVEAGKITKRGSKRWSIYMAI